jgi:hypothetical protein
LHQSGLLGFAQQDITVESFQGDLQAAAGGHQALHARVLVFNFVFIIKGIPAFGKKVTEKLTLRS